MQKYKSYFIENWYVCGHSAYKDANSLYVQGRVDDVIMTAGEQLSRFVELV